MVPRPKLLTQPNALAARRQGAIEVHRIAFAKDYSPAFLRRLFANYDWQKLHQAVMLGRRESSARSPGKPSLHRAILCQLMLTKTWR